MKLDSLEKIPELKLIKEKKILTLNNKIFPINYEEASQKNDVQRIKDIKELEGFLSSFINEGRLKLYNEIKLGEFVKEPEFKQIKEELTDMINLSNKELSAFLLKQDYSSKKTHLNAGLYLANINSLLKNNHYQLFGP